MLITDHTAWLHSHSKGRFINTMVKFQKTQKEIHFMFYVLVLWLQVLWSRNFSSRKIKLMQDNLSFRQTSSFNPFLETYLSCWGDKHFGVPWATLRNWESPLFEVNRIFFFLIIYFSPTRCLLRPCYGWHCRWHWVSMRKSYLRLEELVSPCCFSLSKSRTPFCDQAKISLAPRRVEKVQLNNLWIALERIRFM